MTVAPLGTDLARRFRRFADRECAGISPLYAELARQVSGNAFLLDLAARARPGQPPPNMLLAAVHFLLRRGETSHPLAEFYASLRPQPLPPERAFPPFEDFCRARAPDIADLLGRRSVNTNEVQRSACLLPAFGIITRRSAAPLHLIEVGASAGLNLLWDRYAYDYGSARRLGPANAPLRLNCEPRGCHGPPIPGETPMVGRRLGIDPTPLSPSDPEDTDWLRALVWPEQRERAERLSAALRLAAELEPEVIRGEGTALLPGTVDSMPPDGTPCIFHCFTLNQFDAEARGRFRETMRNLGRKRLLFQIGLEWADAPAPELVMTRHGATGAETERLAFCDAHGTWIEWLHPSHAESGIDRKRPEP